MSTSYGAAQKSQVVCVSRLWVCSMCLSLSKRSGVSAASLVSLGVFVFGLLTSGRVWLLSARTNMPLCAERQRGRARKRESERIVLLVAGCSSLLNTPPSLFRHHLVFFSLAIFFLAHLTGVRATSAWNERHGINQGAGCDWHTGEQCLVGVTDMDEHLGMDNMDAGMPWMDG